MAFCGNCGNQLQGDERFCVKCGKDVSAKPATTASSVAPTAAATAAPPVPPAAPPVRPIMAPMQPVAAAPGPYAAPGAVPIAVAVPQAQKHGGITGLVVLLVLIAGAGYYYYTHKTPPTPAKPAVDNITLAKQQTFGAHWNAINGFIQISNGKWTNNSQYPVQSATLECDQYDVSGTDLDQMRTTLNGPLQPGATDTFNPFQMGAVANNLSSVTCTIVHVKQPSDQSQSQ